MRAVLDERERTWGAAVWDRRLFHESGVTKLRSVWLRNATQLLVENRLDDAAAALGKLQEEADGLQDAQQLLLDAVRYGSERATWDEAAGPLVGIYQLDKQRTLQSLKPSDLVKQALSRGTVRLRLVGDGIYAWWMTLEGTRVLSEGGRWRPAATDPRAASLEAHVRGIEIMDAAEPWPGAPLRLDPEERTFWFAAEAGAANPWATQVERELEARPLSGGKIEILEPEPGQRFSEKTIKVRGTVESSIADGVLRVNDRVVPLVDNAFETTVELDDAPKRAIKVTYSGSGAFGTEKAYVHVGIDTKPPVIELDDMKGVLLDASQGAYCTNEAQLEFRGRVLDQAVARVDVFMGGARRVPNTTEIEGGIEFRSKLRSLSERAAKPVVVEVRAIDDMGNQAESKSLKLVHDPARFDQLRFGIAMRKKDYYEADRIENVLRDRHNVGVKSEYRNELAKWRKKPVVTLRGLTYMTHRTGQVTFPIVVHGHGQPLRFELFLRGMRPTDKLRINDKPWTLTPAQRAGKDPVRIDDTTVDMEGLSESGMAGLGGYVSIHIEDTYRELPDQRFATGFAVWSVPLALLPSMVQPMGRDARVQTGDVVLPNIGILTPAEALARASSAFGDEDD